MRWLKEYLIDIGLIMALLMVLTGIALMGVDAGYKSSCEVDGL